MSPSHLCLAFVTILQAVGAGHQAVAEDAPVVGTATVISADTLEINERRIQLAELTGPAIDQVCLRENTPYACGREAAQYLVNAADGQIVACHDLSPSASDPEKIFGRCYVILPNPPSAPDLDLRVMMLRSGWAWTEPHSALAPDEEYARRNRYGLWGSEFAVSKEKVR